LGIIIIVIIIIVIIIIIKSSSILGIPIRQDRQELYSFFFAATGKRFRFPDLHFSESQESCMEPGGQFQLTPKPVEFKIF
jgi:hypothetical protein